METEEQRRDEIFGRCAAAASRLRKTSRAIFGSRDFIDFGDISFRRRAEIRAARYSFLPPSPESPAFNGAVRERSTARKSKRRSAILREKGERNNPGRQKGE